MTARQDLDHATIGGVRIAYRVEGNPDGEPIVFVNSLGTDMRMWDAQTDALGRDFLVIRYDCRGHGASEVAGDSATLDQLGGDLVGLLDHLGIASAHLCGLSLGGITSLWVAVHHPGRIMRAVFANTAARHGTREGWDARIAAVRDGGMAAVRDVVVGRFLGPAFRAERPEVERWVGEMVVATPRMGYIAACTALRDADLSDVVGGIEVPALIVAGELDESAPPSLSEELHRAIRGSELVVLPGAAHLSSVERPHALSRIITRFLGAA